MYGETPILRTTHNQDQYNLNSEVEIQVVFNSEAIIALVYNKLLASNK